MAGNNPHQALQNFLDPLRRVIACITKSQIVQTAGPDDCVPDKVYSLFVGSDEEIFFKVSSQPTVYAEISMDFVIIEVPKADLLKLGRYKVSTRWYRYNVLNHRRQEMLSYQWHPGTEVDFPHLHVSSLEKCHLPTGRISIEQFAWLLIDAFEVKPRKGCDWKSILKETEGKFKQYRTW
ncbi:MAG: hypothetical protein ABIU05_01350 [Nitrospirales bacterium]